MTRAHRPARPWRVVLLVVFVSLGALAHAWRVAHSINSRVMVPVEGLFWRAFAARGASLSIPVDAPLMLRPGDSLRTLAVDDDATRIQAFGLRLRRAGGQSSDLDLRFRDLGASVYRLQIAPGRTLTATLSYPTPGGSFDLLASASRDDVLANPDDPFDLTLRLDGPDFEVRINDAPLLKARDERLTRGGISMLADGIEVLGIHAEVVRHGGKRLVLDDDLSALRAGRIGTAGALWRAGIDVALTAGLLALFLISLCAGTPSRSRLARAFLAAAAPLAACSIVFAAGPLPAGAGLAGLALGMPFGLFILRRELRAPLTARRLRTLAALAVALVATAALVVPRVDARVAAANEVRRTRANLGPAVAKAPTVLAEPLVLDAGNSFVSGGPYRDLDFETTVTLDPNAVLEVRLRAHPRICEGMGFLLSANPGLRSGFVVEDRADLRPLGEPGPRVASGRALVLRVTCRDDVYEAFVDGERIARAEDDTFGAGPVFVLAVTEHVRVDALRVDPRPFVAPPLRRASFAQYAGAAAGAWLLLACFAGLAAFLLRAPLALTVGVTAFALVPLATAERSGAVTDPSAVAGSTAGMEALPWLLAALGAVLVLLALPLFQGFRAGGARSFVALPLAMVLGAAAAYVALNPRFEPSYGDDPPPELFHFDHMTPGLIHFTSPIVRRFNGYLVDHRFRTRAFTPEKPADTLRVMCLGTSSTWGHGIDESTGLDYPTQIETLLQGKVGKRLEVINAGIRGSGSRRVLFFFEEVLLPRFHPDVVTLSFFFNESNALTRFDEVAYYERALRPDYAHGFLERMRARMERTQGNKLFDRLHTLMHDRKIGAGDAWASLDPGRPSPVERYEAAMRRFAELGREHDFDVVLIKEPVKEDLPWMWKEEFYAATDRVAKDYGLRVVEPGPTLRHAGGARLYQDDIHPTADGTTIVAKLIAPHLWELLNARAKRDQSGR